MKSKFLIFTFTLYAFMSCQLYGEQSRTVCLNMIVKNETEVICRCLASVKPFIDYWVIVDTGSSDGTQQMIKDFMQDIPGELHERPWRNFGHNRNEALELAKNKSDYILFIDADEVLSIDKGCEKPLLDKDFYYITTHFNGMHYGRTQLIKNDLNWRWSGVLHEAVDCKEAVSSDVLKGVANIVSTDGARSKDPLKFHKDAEILEAAMLEDPANKRNAFYLAQSYKDAGETEKAIIAYQKRIAMGGWDQEVFWSKLQIAILEDRLQKPLENLVANYLHTFNYRASRAEPLYYLANLYRRHDDFENGYQVAWKGINVPFPKDVLFVDHWIYEHGLLLEYSICAYYTERYAEAKLASQLMLANPNLPQHVRQCVQNNMAWINSKLNLPSLPLPIAAAK